MICKNKKMVKQGFVQGIILLIFSQIIIKLLGLTYKLYLTNKQGFGDSGNAIYSAGFQIYALLLTLSSIGVPNAVAKMVSEKNSIGDNKGAHRIFKIAFFIFSGIGFLCSFILFKEAKNISINILQIPEAEKSLIALAPSIFFVSIISVIRGYFNGMQCMKATANSQTIEQLLKTFLTICLVEITCYFFNGNTTLMAASGNLATTFATMGSFFYLYKFYIIRKKDISYNIKQSFKYKRKRSLSIIKDILCITVPMSLTSILMTINKNVDSVTVVRGLKNFLSNDEAIIQYGILSGKVDTLINLPLSFNMAFATALVPTVSAALARKNILEVNKKVTFSILTTMLIGVPCTAGMIVFAEPILNLLFPNASSGYIVLEIAAFSIVFTMLSQILNGALQGIGKIFIPAISLSIGVLVKTILNIILIPISSEKFILGGVNGAAFATVICHIIAFFISFFVLRKKLKLKLDVHKILFKPIIATIFMIAALYFTNKILKCIIIEKLATILSILIAIIVYILAIVFLKIFGKNEILLLPYGEKILNLMEKIGIQY